MKTKFSQKRPWYKEFHFDSLDEFRSWYGNKGISESIISPRKFVFRGIGKANNYTLIPAAFRQNVRGLPSIVQFLPNNLGDSLPAKQQPILYYIALAELTELQLFYAEANMKGLVLPNIDYFQEQLSVAYHRKYLEKLKQWPDRSFVEIMALAQHYGLPTRMLDWTYDFRVALYFSLKDVVKRIADATENGKDSGKLEPYAVWAIDVANIQSIYEDYTDLQCPIKFHVPPYANNPNLNAQKGLLAYQVTPDYQSHSADAFSISPMDAVLDMYFQRLNQEVTDISYDGAHIIKFVFHSPEPVSEFRYLVANGYNAASLFPGFAGVVQKIYEDKMIHLAQG